MPISADPFFLAVTGRKRPAGAPGPRIHSYPSLLWLAVVFLFAQAAKAAVPLVTLTPNVLYQTEHCLFIVDSSVTWATPATAYNELYGYSGDPLNPFPKLNTYYNTLVAQFPGTYFSVCYIANTGASNVPNYIDRIYKASGINEPGTAGAPQSFAAVDICRYNLPGGNIFAPVLAVYDHELGHAWGAQVFNDTLHPPYLSNGHWLPNSTIDCQLGFGFSTDGYVTLNKIYGDPVNGFRWQKVDNLRSNDFETFSEQQLYLMGLRATWPTAYVLNNAVYNPDLTVGSSSVDRFDHTALVATYGARTPDYTVAPKRFKLGFVYIARDAAEVNTVYQAVEQSASHFCNAEAIDPHSYRFQTPFLCDTKYRASADGLLSDLDGNSTPVLAVTDTYVSSGDGTAVANFVASDPDGPAPTVSVVPASTCCTIVGSAVQLAGLPDGVHFFTLKAVDAGGKKTFGHFVVAVQRPASSTAITLHPPDQTVTAGNPVNFSVTAAGTPASFSYQWFRRATRESTWNVLAEGGAYSGTATATLAVASAPAMSKDEFLCVVGNGTGTATSNPAVLTVNETAPILATQPADRAVTAGTTVPFSVAPGAPVTTFGYYYYQWQRLPAGSGTWINLTDGGGYNGSTTATLSVLSTLAMSGDQFRCLVSNTTGGATSSAATLIAGNAPVVTAQPVSPVAISAGQNASFTVAATGTAPLAYQWSLYGTAVPGGTGPTLNITNAQAADIGAYSVFITNAFGSTRSNVGSLTVAPAAPTITSQPQSAVVPFGQNVSFSVATAGTTPFTYQWKLNGTALAGATGTTFSVTNAHGADAGNYSVAVGNSVSSTASSTATLKVRVPRSDFNNDGAADILWHSAASGLVASWTSGGGFATFGSESGSWAVIGTGDFDRDGRTDVLWRNSTTGLVAAWTSGAGFTTFGSEGGGWSVIGTDDFDGDGKTDVLWRNNNTGLVAAWTSGAGFTTFGAESGGWSVIGTGDFDGDGKTDILWHDTSSTLVASWTSSGGFTTFGTEAGNWAVIGTGDFDGDRKADLLWRNTATGLVASWTSAHGFTTFGVEAAGWTVIP